MNGKFIENKEIFYKHIYVEIPYIIICGSYSDIETYDVDRKKEMRK